MRSRAEIDDLASRAPDSEDALPVVSIEELRGIDAAREVAALQQRIWSAEDGWVVPPHALMIVAEYGGILLGARVDGELTGFVLGFLGCEDGVLFHASHMLGVLPDSRQLGIGAALKWRQREVALAQGIELMRWTFDPLEARNAHFNLHKLGAVGRTYRVDYYGPMNDGLNRDLPSERLIVEWRLRDAGDSAPDRRPLQPLLLDRGGSPELHSDALVGGGPICIQIPHDVQQIKSVVPRIALQWRLAVREAFTAALSAGYVATDFRDGAYVLMRDEELRA
jgi:predicted GNAT superfamily acetyltransferase